MPKKYKIREGFTFVQSDQTVAVGGDIIELDDDVATQHAHKLEPVDLPKPKSKKDKPDDDGKAPATDGAAGTETDGGDQTGGNPPAENTDPT